MRRLAGILFVIIVFLLIIVILLSRIVLKNPRQINKIPETTRRVQAVSTPSNTQNNTFPLAISTMRQKKYPGSKLMIEQTLSSGADYDQFIVSYLSDGLKIYGLLTVPQGQKPASGWPVILLNHGYIPPTQYSTIQSYTAIVSPLASQGYIVFKPDYRGNGNSEGQPTQVYISSDYVTDSLNALASIKKFKDADPAKIGVFGHSMGGNITLHELVISKDLKAAAIWAGVVGDYTDILSWWDKRVATGVLTTQNDIQTAQLVKQFVSEHGTPQSDPAFWNTIDPTNFLTTVTIPIQLQVGTADEDVPPNFTQTLRDRLQTAGKTVEYQEYPGADHNLAPDQTQALQSTLSFFDKYIK